MCFGLERINTLCHYGQVVFTIVYRHVFYPFIFVFMPVPTYDTCLGVNYKRL